MPTNDERREIAARLRECAPTYRRKGGHPDMTSSLVAIAGTSIDSLFDRLADLIEPESMCVANITFTQEQQEELFQRVMEELRVHGCPNLEH